MKSLLRLGIVALGLLFATQADAATCFWVAGTAAWSIANTASWASGTGGTGGTCAATGGVPKNAGDVATFDASSGGGTVTPNFNISIATITMGAFTGTLDFSVNNNNVTLSVVLADNGTGTRTLKMGSGTWTFTASQFTLMNMNPGTNGTLSAASASLVFANSSPAGLRIFAMDAGQTYGAVSISGAASGDPSFPFYINTISTADVFSSLSLTAPLTVNFTANGTLTLSNVPTWAGSSSAFLNLVSGGLVTQQPYTIKVPNTTSISWMTIGGITFNPTTGSVSATNSLSLGSNSGVTITPPSFGGGGHIIGG